jgi:hypothetical protein
MAQRVGDQLVAEPDVWLQHRPQRTRRRTADTAPNYINTIIGRALYLGDRYLARKWNLISSIGMCRFVYRGILRQYALCMHKA